MCGFAGYIDGRGGAHEAALKAVACCGECWPRQSPPFDRDSGMRPSPMRDQFSPRTGTSGCRGTGYISLPISCAQLTR